MTTNVDDFLAHYGVPGMKWGKRTAAGPSRSERKAAKKEARKQADKEILDARARQEKRAGNLSKKAAATYAQTTKKGQEAADAAYMRAERTYLNGKDAQVAAKATRGEKVVGGLLTGVLATALVAPLAVSLLESRR